MVPYHIALNRFDQETLLYPYTKRPITTSEPPINVFELWVVSNIPGNDISKGNILVEYTCPGPPLHETGNYSHRQTTTYLASG